MPTRAGAAWFWLRSRPLMLWRGWRNLCAGLRRWPASAALADAPVLAQLRAPLWTDGRGDEFALVAGKVQNLRVAARALDGVVVPAGQVLSFWRQVGRPVGRRGYVPGREVRAGCVIPTIAGGICQLSNTLAACARRAGFELLERHAHSARIEQAAPRDADADATVFWNYVDLGIRAAVDWRIDAALTGDELVLTLRAASANAAPEPPQRRPIVPIRVETPPPRQPPVARGCLTCEETGCHLHRPQLRGQGARTAWLLDGWTPEFDQWLRARPGAADRFLPVLPSWLPGRAARRWLQWPSVDDDARTLTFFAASLRRAFWQRLWANSAGKRQASLLSGQRWLAQAYARRLRPEHTHLVIDQGLLPCLQALGALGGRRYEVLARALPMQEIERQLDSAQQQGAARDAGDASLSDFRAGPALMALEAAAMRGASGVVTAHAEVARYWAARGLAVERLAWRLPAMPDRPKRRARGGAAPLIVFPASALARKGFHELTAALRGMNARLRILGAPPPFALALPGVALEYGRYGDGWLADADVVALPAHVEHNPRALLQAIAAGIPVVATPACGVEQGARLVAAGDVSALRQAIEAALRGLPQP